jgi:DNA-binding transcriptional LysR family regulator
MPVTLAQIAAFERIVRLGSFHAAARQLGLTQPSISQRIRELEASLGVELFIRRGPTINLTAEGTALVGYADRLLGTTGEMIERFRARDPLKGVLRLGLNESFGLICLTDLLRRLEERHPALKTSVQVGDTATVSRLLDERQLDLAVVSEPTVADFVAREPLGTNELGWFASTALKLPRRTLSPADLAAQHLIVSPPPARLYTTVTRWFSEAGAAPVRVSMCNSLSVTVLAIASGLAVGLVPVRVMQDAIARQGVRRLAVSPPVPGHRVWICHQAGDFGTSMQQLVELIREVAARHKLFT